MTVYQTWVITLPLLPPLPARENVPWYIGGLDSNTIHGIDVAANASVCMHKIQTRPPTMISTP
jgi:hypothetical protein